MEFFLLRCRTVVFLEYFALYMKQLGLSLVQISLVQISRANPASVLISQRQISSQETRFNRTVSGLLHYHCGSCLATCRVVADMLSKTERVLSEWN